MSAGERKPYGKPPWESEPKGPIEWAHRGYRCMLKRSRLGCWCGYVGVPSEHPWYERHYFQDLEREVDVHGGLTFSDKDRIAYDGGRFLWWVGFDCGGMNDLVPELLRIAPSTQQGCTYRDIAYARAEAESLAEQAEEAMKGASIEELPKS